MIAEYEQIKHGLPDFFTKLESFYMVTHYDTNGTIIYTNKRFLDASSWTPKRVLGKTFWQMFSDDLIGETTATKIWNQVQNGKPWSGQVQLVTRFGEPYHVHLSAIPLTEEGIQKVIVLALDMTEEVHLKEKLQKIAYIDYETGLMSRHSLENRVSELIEQKESFSFVYLMIDRFYQLNESLEEGEEKVLTKTFSQRLTRFFQDNDIARIGVNEFVVLTPFGDWYIDGFLEFLQLQPIYINHTPIQLSVSGGIARHPEDQQSYHHLLQAAMAATKEVIQHGGGRIQTLSAQTHRSINRRTLIEKALPHALANEQLEVVYQPQFSVSTKEVQLYEALIRWEDEELGTISPEELIPIAEDIGLISKIGEFVLEEAAKLLAAKTISEQTFKIAINSSIREFSDPTWSERIISILQRIGCPPSAIELEITEKFALKAEEESSILQQMQMLGQAGIQFALDDFGTGYASFRYMQSLPISKVKVDPSYIHAMTTHEQTEKLIRGLVMLGETMDFTVIAEGVETEEQLICIKNNGLQGAQGYYLGEPVTGATI